MDIQSKLELLSKIDKLESVTYAFENTYLNERADIRKATNNFIVICDMLEDLKTFVAESCSKW